MAEGPADVEAGREDEVNALAALFPRGRARVLLGSDASEQRLDELAAGGELQAARILHFATHGAIDADAPQRSALLLARDRLPDSEPQAPAGGKVYTGRLTAAAVRSWRLDADLVVLAACETGLGKDAGGDGFLGFVQPFFRAGARSLVVSLWKVNDTATALLMVRFYQNLLGSRDGMKAPLPKAEALHEAKHWLRTRTADQIDQAVARLPNLERGEVRSRPKATAGEAHPYGHPYYWSAFILLGDPD